MSKEHSYAYEAGYRDGSTHYELEHCPACKNVADLQETLAENVRLRELVRELYEDQCCDGDQWKYRDRMRELGVVIGDG